MANCTRGGVAADFAEIYSVMVDSDVVIASTSAPHAVVREEPMRQVVRDRGARPLQMDLTGRMGVLCVLGALGGTLTARYMNAAVTTGEMTAKLNLTGRDAVKSPEGLADRIAKKAFDAEIAFRFEPKRSIVWYDRNDDGAFDLILIDEDLDGTADRGYRLAKGKWVSQTDVNTPWLSTSYLKFLKRAKTRSKARHKIRRTIAR